MEISKSNWNHDSSPSGVDEIQYKSKLDGIEDWALSWVPPNEGGSWIVNLHGHGSSGDQIYTREDIREAWIPKFRELGLGILSPNVRGNAWMCPKAVQDLHNLLQCMRNEYGAKSFYFFSASMGGTGNLIYAVQHPEDVTALASLCPVSNIQTYHEWCCNNSGGVRDEIRQAIEAAYGGSPDQVSDRFAGHIVVQQAERLSMPAFVSHAVGDDVIPVQQSQELNRCLGGSENFQYVEIDGGDHDTPLYATEMFDWLERVLN